MRKKYQSEILQVIHEDAKGMHELGIISDERMSYYDNECLVQKPEKPRKTASSDSRSQSGSDGTKPTVRISAKSTGS